MTQSEIDLLKSYGYDFTLETYYIDPEGACYDLERYYDAGSYSAEDDLREILQEAGFDCGLWGTYYLWYTSFSEELIWNPAFYILAALDLIAIIFAIVFASKEKKNENKGETI